MAGKIHVAMLDDHQLILDGIYFRLKEVPEIEVVAMLHYGDELEPMLEENQVDVLILDISVPMSEDDTVYALLLTAKRWKRKVERTKIKVQLLQKT